MLRGKEYICQRCSSKEAVDDVRAQRLESKLTEIHFFVIGIIIMIIKEIESPDETHDTERTEEALLSRVRKPLTCYSYRKQN